MNVREKRSTVDPIVAASAGYGEYHAHNAQYSANREDDVRDAKRYSNVTFTKRVDHEGGPTLCPPCKQRWSGLPCGFVRIEGAFAATHLDEIERLMVNEAERAALDNHTARVMTWDRERPGVLELTTTTPHLAQRLGHALEKAYTGTVRYDFSHENPVARITWRRD